MADQQEKHVRRRLFQRLEQGVGSAALQIIGKAGDARLVSSFFLMLGCAPGTALRGGMIFSDCGLVVDPSVEELAGIAIAAARSCRPRARGRRS